MAKKAYIGIDGTARKITKAYIGIDGVARRIKKAYVGVAGVARPCYSINAIEWQGKVADLSVKRCWGASASTPSYALFAGGSTDARNGAYGSRVDTVDAFNSTYGRVQAESCLDTTIGSGISFNNKAIFCGGTRQASRVLLSTGVGTPSSSGIYYGDDLVMHALTGMYNTFGHAITSTAKHCIIGGGIAPASSSANPGTLLDTVVAYDTSLTKRSATALSAARYLLGAATAGQYAMFVGGSLKNSGSGSIYDTMSDAIDVYSSDLTHSILSFPRESCCVGVSGKNYALFSSNIGDTTDILYAYSADLTRSPVSASSNSVSVYSRTTRCNNYAIIAAGNSDKSGSIKSLDFYDESLTRIDALVLLSDQIGSSGILRGSTCMSTVEKEILLAQSHPQGLLYTDVYALSIA